MGPKQKVLAIRLADKIARKPDYAKSIGIITEKKEKELKKETAQQKEVKEWLN